MGKEERQTRKNKSVSHQKRQGRRGRTESDRKRKLLMLEGVRLAKMTSSALSLALASLRNSQRDSLFNQSSNQLRYSRTPGRLRAGVPPSCASSISAILHLSPTSSCPPLQVLMLLSPASRQPVSTGPRHLFGQDPMPIEYPLKQPL